MRTTLFGKDFSIHITLIYIYAFTSEQWTPSNLVHTRVHKQSQIRYMYFCVYKKRNIFHITREEKIVPGYTIKNTSMITFLYTFHFGCNK